MARAKAGLEQVSHRVFAERYFSEWILQCPACGRRYRVVDDQGYWKTLYQWEALDPR